MNLLQTTRRAAAVLLTTAAIHNVSYAQEVYPPPKTTFEQLGYRPTGRNGYEELIIAGDFIRGNQALQLAQGDSTLADKRIALQEAAVRRALDLLRIGLSKPIYSVYSHIDIDTTFPQFAGFRNLARTLMIEQYVLLADGKVSLAISSMIDGLRLSQALQSETPISGLVGIAVTAISVTLMAKHLDQLSARDCDRVVALARAWLDIPSGVIAAMSGERALQESLLQKLRANPRKELLDSLQDDEDPLARDLAKFIDANPSGLEGFVDQLVKRMGSIYEASMAELRKPPWERGDVVPLDASLAGKLASRLVPSIGTIGDRYVMQETSIRLLGVHAAIHRFKWEFNRLPNTLTEMKLGSLAVDPFTGKSLTYERKGEGYELYGAGALDRDDDGKLKPGVRTPYYLPFRPKVP